MSEVASTAIAQQRFNMMLIGIFAAVALTLTMVGLYGLLSYQVAQRTREIGVRMALGARGADVLCTIVIRGLILTAVGMAVGIAGSLGLARFLKTLLFGVAATSQNQNPEPRTRNPEPCKMRACINTLLLEPRPSRGAP